MRPEIASLVKPIYPNLQNHPSVENQEPIKGISSNLFFISHAQPEAHDDETKSHSNLYEAQYLAQLCQYLLKQGYDASRITVLTTYSGECGGYSLTRRPSSSGSLAVLVMVMVVIVD